MSNLRLSRRSNAALPVCFLSVNLAIQFIDGAAADELSTTQGDHLSGEIVSLNADFVTFRHAEGSVLTLPYKHISSLSGQRRLAISLRNGDRVVGLLQIDLGGELRIRSEILGELRLPPSAVKIGAPVGSSQSADVPSSVETLAPASAASISGRGPTSDMEPEGPPSPTERPTDRMSSAPANPTTGVADNDDAGRTELRFLRADTVLLRRRQFEADVALSYLRDDQNPASDRSIALTGTLRAGLWAGLEGFISLPLVYGVRDIQLGETISQTNSGIGDIAFGLNYQLVNEDATSPGLFFGLSASAPTGDDPYVDVRDIGSGTPIDIRSPFTTALGSGHWILSLSLSVVRSYDPVILSAGISYSHAFSKTYYGHDIQPGDRYNGNIGLGFSISELSSLGFRVFGGYEERWSFDGKGASGTESWPLNAQISYTHKISPKNFLEPSITFGLTENTTDAVLNLTYTHLF